MAKRGRLRLVSSHDPASVFDDLDALRKAQKTGLSAEAPLKGQRRQRRQRSNELFARVPFDRARALGRQNVSGAAWRLLIELVRLIFEGHGKNPVKLTNHYLRAAGLGRNSKRRALRELVKGGVISVEQRPGQAPLVTYLWVPVTWSPFT
jgi:hypothetical protein